MTRRDWWLGVILIVGALLLHLAFPRYQYTSFRQSVAMIRVDRWTGHTTVVMPDRDQRAAR